MLFFSRLFGKGKKLGISTELIKEKIYECLSEGKFPEQVLADQRIADWELQKSKRDALLYIEYIDRRMRS
jgi:hypothetical protein